MRRRRIVPTVLAAAAAALALMAGPAAAAAPAPAASTGSSGSTDTAAAVAVRGGDLLYGDSGRSCIVGYNARDTSAYYAILSGHCADGNRVWYADPGRTVRVGETRAVSFPANDYALVRYSNPEVLHPGEISLGGGVTRDITGAANPTVGQSACQAGGTTGVHCGTVLQVNVTINYPEGSVSGLFRTNLCTEPGQGGAPVFSGSTALGVGSAASGNCSSGGTTFHQPVVEVLNMYGLSIY